MATDIRLTMRDVAESIQRQYGGVIVPDWKIRRVVDDLEQDDMIVVQRVGRYRTVSDNDIKTIATELHRLSWLTESPVSGGESSILSAPVTQIAAG